MSSSEFLRLELIEVDKLFGVYNHRIKLNLESHITLLHGPNGVGKTVVLRLINAFLQHDLSHFKDIPFSRFYLQFHDGSFIELKENNAQQRKNFKHVLTLRQNGEKFSSGVHLKTEAQFIASQVDHLVPQEKRSNFWKDIRDGELLSSSDIIERYRHLLEREDHSDEDLSWFSAFLQKANVHLIEAQRLVRLKQNNESQQQMIGFWTATASHASMFPTVIEYSQDFQKRLRDTMAQYGRQSQALDQTFPQRLISATETLYPDDLQHKMTHLDAKTKIFKDIGVLEETPTPPFDVAQLQTMDPTQARVMTLYVSDTEKKLAALDSLANRSLLLLNSINHKFRNKKIRLDHKDGFVVDSDANESLPLDSLSSGEQHELVLHYDLLFKVPPNTIVLIDEPELSLHVAWQKKFLADLLDIVEISNFDALIATHSPYIIGDKTALMVGLGENS